MADEQKSTSKVTIVLGVIGTLVTVASLTEAIISRKTAQELQKQIEDGKRATEAAAIRQQFAIHQTDLAEQKKKERAWLQAAISEKNQSMVIENPSHTIATNVVSQSCVLKLPITTHLNQQLIDKCLEEPGTPSSLIPPGGSHTLSMAHLRDNPFSGTDKDNFVYYMMGLVQYSDNTGERHVLHWCAQTDDKVYTYCRTANSSE